MDEDHGEDECHEGGGDYDGEASCGDGFPDLKKGSPHGMEEVAFHRVGAEEGDVEGG